MEKKDDFSKNLLNFNPKSWTIGIHDLGMPFGVSFHV